MTPSKADIPLTVRGAAPSPGDRRARDGIARDLETLIAGEVRFGDHDRMLYATDASIYQVAPIGVAVPRTIADVEAIVGYAARHQLPILPRGAGTSLAGQAVNGAIVVDFSVHLDQLQQIDAAEATVRVEPGVVLDQLNDAAAPYGLMFGPDVATSTHANLGGMIGNNSSGAHSILYGRTVDHVIGLDVVLADGTRLWFDEGAAQRDEHVGDLTRRVAEVVHPLVGEIERRFPKTLRRVNGYNLDLVLDDLRRSTPGTFDRVNLAHLLCGSEGTLGVVVGAKLRLVSAPPLKGLAIAAFADLMAALDAVRPILATKPAAVELIDDVVLGLARRNTEYSRYVDLLPARSGQRPAAVLYVEYFADGPDELERSFAALADAVGAAPLTRYTDPAAMAAAWKLRKAGEPLLYGAPGKRRPITFIEDTAVDPSRLPEFVTAFDRIITDHGTRAAYYAHASVGCLHMRPMIDLHDPADVEVMQAIAADVTELVQRFEGALSGEHGDGRLRSHLLERFYGKAICDGFRAIKAIFDPEGRLNPGNIVDPRPMAEALRVSPAGRPVRVAPIKTFFRYRHEQGLEPAVEMCNGAGVCRKTSGGTMCPSYRATRDERHATRGRGNALRLAITGQLSDDGHGPAWNDAETIQTLDLCLACKACKSECPSNVDVARLKAEYLGQRYAHSARIGLPTRLFGRVRGVNRLGSAIAPLANAAAGLGPARWALNRVLGLHPRRSLPRFGRSLYRWHANRRALAGKPSVAPVVVLLPDCFTVYTEPHIGRAAVAVLEALGYRVVLPRLGCCGRALISTGMMAEALVTCRATAEALSACVHQSGAVAVVGCEPSCVSAITDDWPDLDMGVDDAMLDDLAASTMLIEDLIESGWDDHPRRPDVRLLGGDGAVLLHGHCHQKALWGLENCSRLLRRVAGDRLKVLDSGCCGMAGSFGFARAHYDLSMRIGEPLFGLICADPHATVVAPGTSCRHQVRDALGRQALHPVELVARGLGGPRRD